LIRKSGSDPRVLARAPEQVVEVELKGPRPSVQRGKRRLLVLQGVLVLASIIANVVLYTVTGIDEALVAAGGVMVEMYGFVGILVPAAHAGLAFLLVSGVQNAGRYAARGTWVMVMVHLAWGGGFMAGHLPALPVGLVLVAGNLLFLWWLRPVREDLDAGREWTGV
jgi:hypothetical protein